MKGTRIPAVFPFAVSYDVGRGGAGDVAVSCCETPCYRKAPPLDEYVNMQAFAKILGHSQQWVSDLRKRGHLPEPDAMQGNRPLWLRSTAERYAEERRKRLSEE